MAGQGLRVTIWNEHVHEREDARVAAIYPDGSTARSRRRWRGIAPASALLRAVLGDRPAPTEAADNIRSLAMVEAAIGAARGGGWVEVERP